MTRREFTAGLTLTQTAPRPNILWITCEDISTVLGCYGDRYAATPNLDRFAAQGLRYTRAYATAPVCSPARSCLITGVHANSLGSANLRNMVVKPASVPCFPELLRQAGYYTSNNEKEDYNFERPPGCWDESSGKAHWRKRPKGRPFFSVFNLMTTHQGQIRYSREEFNRINAALPPALRHDPARAPVPPYYPDTADVRLNLAILHTQVTRMDQQAGDLLRQLADDGLAEDTIIFFFGDNGTGLPRGKRFLNDAGIHVPFMVRFPAKYRHWAPAPPGAAVDRLVSFVDFAPTVLSLAGIPAPPSMQGVAFLGPRAGAPRTEIYASRDRVDEEFEVSRTILDGRYHYIRHYYPHRPVLQHGTYSEVGHLWKELRRLHAAGQLSGPARELMADSKPPEELYDLAADPHQIRNLAADPAHRAALASLGGRLRRWMIDMRDTGLLPEADLLRRSGARPPYDMARDPAALPIQRIVDAAELAGRGPSALPDIRRLFSDRDPAVRYWAVIAVTALGPAGASAQSELARSLTDIASAVRIAAAEALCRLGQPDKALPVLAKALAEPDACVQLQAVNSIWHLGALAKPILPALKAALAAKTAPEYQRTYFEWAAEKTLARF